MDLTMQYFFNATLPYLEHHISTGHLLVVSSHKQLVRRNYNAALLVLITIVIGDSDGIIV